METQLEIKKKQLINQIESLDDVSFIDSLLEIIKQQDFDFDEAWKKGYTPDEVRERATNFINSLSWEK